MSKQQQQQCEMCGKEVSSTTKARVEGVPMEVCKDCLKYGEALKQTQQNIAKPHKKTFTPQVAIKDDIEFVDIHFAEIIKNRREEMNMRQKDLARYLNERESTIHQLESGHLKPSQSLIEKLKQKMGINLLRKTTIQEAEEQEPEKIPKTFTLGDLMKIKKK